MPHDWAESRRSFPCSSVLAGIALLLGVIGCSGPPPQPKPPVAAVVRVAPVERREIAVQIPVVGTVVPADVSRVAAGTEGNVVSYPFREGVFVEEGETLATLRPVTLELQIAEAEAMLREKRQRLAELESGMRPEEIAQAEARMSSAKAEAEMAEAQTKRIEELYSRSDRAVTSRERDLANFEAERTRQAYLEAKADFELKTAGYRREQIEAARAAVDAQRSTVERFKDELAKKTIKAPYSGYLVERHTHIGEWVETGGLVATLARLDEVEVRVNVEESHIHEIEVASRVDVKIDALESESVPGVVERIVPRSEWGSGSRSFPVIVRIKNTITAGRPLLHEGMVARIVFRGRPRKALLADKDAIVRSTGKPLVFAVGEGNKVRAIEVVEGLSEGQYIEIEGDVRVGDMLVTEGVEQLRPFDEVEILNKPALKTALSEQE